MFSRREPESDPSSGLGNERAAAELARKDWESRYGSFDVYWRHAP